MDIYVVTMYRWGNAENHSYVLGAYDSKEQALVESHQEEMNRGGKYEARIFSGPINVNSNSGASKDEWVKLYDTD
jgi:hypothetical protein